MSYGGINAKVKAMKGNLYTYDDYYALCGLKTVAAIGKALLENKSYHQGIASIAPGETYSRGILERKLLLSFAWDFSRIYRFVSDTGVKKYLKTLAAQNEIRILKLIICSIADRRDNPFSPQDLGILLQEGAAFDVEKLAGSATIHDLVDGLRGSGYEEVLNKQAADQSPFSLEMRLDIYYYTRLWRSVGLDLLGKNQQMMKMVNGAEIDLQNLLWLYRLKSFYQVENHLLYSYLIPIHYRLRREEISLMAEAANSSQLLAEIEKTAYRPYFIQGERPEVVYYNTLSAIYRKTAAMDQNSIGVAVNYLFLKKLEIKNLVSLMEGVRYGLAPEEIMGYLHIPKGGALEAVI